MRILQICNPVSGRGLAGKKAPKLSCELETRGHSVKTCVTKGPGDAKAFAAEALLDFDAIVVAGGDGTLNEVVNGLDHHKPTPIAIVPSGSANVLARDLAIPKDVAKIAQMIERRFVRSFDLARIGDDRLFCAMAGVGFDATVVREVARRRDGRLGMRGYIQPILSTMLKREEPSLSICIDGAAPLRAAAVLIMNTRNYAGILTASSNAALDSGHLDVVILPKTGILSLARYGMAGLRQGINLCAEVTTVRAERVSIHSARPTDIQIDGEYFGLTPANIEILPLAVPFIVP